MKAYATCVLMSLVLGTAHAKSIAVSTVSQPGVTLMLTDEPCQLDVKNLPYRATWQEGGKVFQGCWALHGNAVAMYFEDKTIAAVPASHFRSAVEI